MHVCSLWYVLIIAVTRRVVVTEPQMTYSMTHYADFTKVFVQNEKKKKKRLDGVGVNVIL